MDHGSVGRGLAAQILAEFRRLLRRPWSELIAVGTNAALVCVGWVILPDGAKTWLFSNLRPLAFAAVLEI